MFGIFNKKKDWLAQIEPIGRTITVKAGDNLLKAALGAGLRWPHDCRVGSCTTCRCILRQGEIKELSDFTYVLDQEQLQSGMILACQTALRSDIVIDVALLDEAEMPITETACHEGVIQSVTPLTHDIVELIIKTNDDFSRLALAGQYAEISVKGIDKPRSYSFAKAPDNEASREFTFYVRQVPGGEFTEWLFAQERTGEPVTVTEPYGSFWLRPGESPIVCMAGGSGMAPVKALLENAHASKIDREVLFLFGARTQKDLYCLDNMQYLQNDWKGSFQFIPVLSEEPEDSNWEGARGMVTDYLQQAYIDTGEVDISASQGYLCGPPPMVDAAITLLNSAGMREEDIYFDKFLDASTMPGGRP